MRPGYTSIPEAIAEFPVQVCSKQETHPDNSEFILEDGKLVSDEIPSDKIPSNNEFKDGKIRRIND